MYSDITLQQDLTIKEGWTLIIPSGVTLTVGSGKILTNNGTISKYLGSVINGTMTGNQPVGSDLTITGTVGSCGTIND
jgi:hypothetical protein